MRCERVRESGSLPILRLDALTRLALIVVVLAACGSVPNQQFNFKTTVPSEVVVTIAPSTSSPSTTARTLTMQQFPVGANQGPHDVAPAADGGVWFTAQRSGELGYLDPKTGTYRMTKLGAGSAPHGVIVGPDGAPWVTDGGLNAIVRVDPKTSEVKTFPLGGPNVNLNTATFDKNGVLWFTGQSGYYGYLKDGRVTVLQAPRGAGPYGIATCPSGTVVYASLAGSHIAQVILETAAANPIDLPTKAQGARRVWCDSKDAVWISEWNAGQVGMMDTRPVIGSATGFREWKLPGASPMAYAVYVDDEDVVWLSDFGANAIVRFDPQTQTFTSLPFDRPNAAVRQLLGRPGEVWGAMSGQDRLFVIRTR